MDIVIAEFLGTLLLVLLGNGVVANVLLNKTKGHHSGWIVISAGWGFAVTMGVYLAGWVSGGHLNPAVTLGLAIVNKTPWGLVPLYFLGQLLGGFVGAFLAWLVYYPHFKKTEQSDIKLLCFATKPAIRKPLWNFVTETIATAVLLIGVLAIFNTHNQMSASFGPYAVGILIFSIGLSLGGPTGYAINPARDFCPRVIYTILQVGEKGSADWKYAWIPIVGPCLGGILGAIIYQLLMEALSTA